MRRAHSQLVWATSLMTLAGCAPNPLAMRTTDRMVLKPRARACLEAAVQYEHNPVVRIEAVEALESGRGEQGLPWIRSGLQDEHPGVRFAACVAAGRLGDAVSRQRLRELVEDEDASVQVAALFALHRLGHAEQTGRMPTYLLRSEEVTVRRNAALLIGMLDEPSAIKVLARGMRDADAGVRHHALEGMAGLGNHEARQELTFMANAGVGSEEVFAITALAQTADVLYLDTFRYKLATATHLETRLSAARGLGLLGSDEGFDVALRALSVNRPLHADPDDPAADQILRVRQMAAAALGAIGSPDALSALARQLETDPDPRVQVSAARAILEILDAERARALPFAVSDRQTGG